MIGVNVILDSNLSQRDITSLYQGIKT